MNVKKLEKLKDLKDKGILSQEEFDKQVVDYINTTGNDLEKKDNDANNISGNISNLKVKHLVYLIIVSMFFYIVVETAFPKYIPCRDGLSDKQCECVRLAVSRNVGFLNKIKIFVIGASAPELSSYIGLEDALRCSFVDDDSTKSSNDASIQSLSTDFDYSYYDNGQVKVKCNKEYCWEYYESGEIKAEINYQNDSPNGPFKGYYESGRISAEGTHKDGKLEGIVRRYYENGEIKEEIYYQNNVKNGPFKWYYENGKISAEGIYKDNKFEGVIKSYYDNGRLVSEEEFKDGKRNGILRRYYDDGILQSSSIWDKGEKAGLTIYYNKDGRKIPSGSRVIFYYNNGNIESEFTLLKNGRIGGVLKRYYTNGKLMMTKSYHNDKLEGSATSYYMNGNIKNSAIFKNGKLDGESIDYNIGGSIKSKTIYKDGKPQ